MCLDYTRQDFYRLYERYVYELSSITYADLRKVYYAYFSSPTRDEAQVSASLVGGPLRNCEYFGCNYLREIWWDVQNSRGITIYDKALAAFAAYGVKSSEDPFAVLFQTAFYVTLLQNGMPFEGRVHTMAVRKLLESFKVKKSILEERPVLDALAGNNLTPKQKFDNCLGWVHYELDEIATGGNEASLWLQLVRNSIMLDISADYLTRSIYGAGHAYGIPPFPLEEFCEHETAELKSEDIAKCIVVSQPRSPRKARQAFKDVLASGFVQKRVRPDDDCKILYIEELNALWCRNGYHHTAFLKHGKLPESLTVDKISLKSVLPRVTVSEDLNFVVDGKERPCDDWRIAALLEITRLEENSPGRKAFF